MPADRDRGFKLILMGAFSCLLLIGSAFGAVGDITISTPDSNPVQGSSFISEVKVDTGATVLGSYQVAFTFNKDVLQITAVEGGNTAEFSGAPTYSSIETANTAGQINIVGYNSSITSPKNLVSIFKITFNVIGAAGSSSTLSVSVTDLLDPDSNTITHNVIDSVVIVAQLSPCPECTGDPVVLTNVTFTSGTACECSATTSITIGSGVTIKSGAIVTFKAPTVKLQSGFHAEEGAVVNIRQQ